MVALNPQQQYQQYQQNSIMSANPGQLTLMLYNGAIKFIKTAINSLEKKDLGVANTNIIKAQNIIRYLDETLDHNYEIADQLSNLYDFFYRHLIEANIKKDPSMMEEVVGMVEEIRDTWMIVLKETKQ